MKHLQFVVKNFKSNGPPTRNSNIATTWTRRNGQSRRDNSEVMKYHYHVAVTTFENALAVQCSICIQIFFLRLAVLNWERLHTFLDALWAKEAYSYFSLAVFEDYQNKNSQVYTVNKRFDRPMQIVRDGPDRTTSFLSWLTKLNSNQTMPVQN